MEINSFIYKIEDKVYYRLMDEHGNISTYFLFKHYKNKKLLDNTIIFGNLKGKINKEKVDLYLYDPEDIEISLNFDKLLKVKVNDPKKLISNEKRLQKIVWKIVDEQIYNKEIVKSD